MVAALAEDVRTVHEGMEDNVLLDVRMPDDPEVDKAFEEAPVSVEARFTTGRVAAVPMEGRACLAEWDGREGKLVLYTSTQVPHIAKYVLSGITWVPEQKLRVVAPDVCGGLGNQLNVYAE